MRIIHTYFWNSIVIIKSNKITDVDYDGCDLTFFVFFFALTLGPTASVTSFRKLGTLHNVPRKQ